MNTQTNKFRIRLGLFVIGGLAIFLVAIFIIGKQKNLFNPVFKLTTTFYNVSGLQVGNNVRFSGINVGTVDNIVILDGSTVQVDMLLRTNVKKFIKKDCKVALGSEGLIGDRLLIISQGSAEAPLAEDGQMLLSTEPVEMDAIMASVQVTAGNIEIITKELAEVAAKINSGNGTLARLIADESIAENFSQSMLSLKSSTSTLPATTKNIELMSKQLVEISGKINSGDGTLGRLIQDTSIAENFSQSMLNLKNSTKGLDETLEAAKHNFLLKGYFKKKEKAANKAAEDAEDAAEEDEYEIIFDEPETPVIEKPKVIEPK
jgi:phospholipid/cholesterol/gamma-HCH transport system substrate-binding protein